MDDVFGVPLLLEVVLEPADVKVKEGAVIIGPTQQVRLSSSCHSILLGNGTRRTEQSNGQLRHGIRSRHRLPQLRFPGSAALRLLLVGGFSGHVRVSLSPLLV